MRSLLQLLPVLAVLVIRPACVSADESAGTATTLAEAELRESIRRYDDALRKRDVAAVERFWAAEYTFTNPRGERLTRADRLANLRTERTTFDALVHDPQDQQIRIYGDVAVYTALMTLTGRYGGQEQNGQDRALVVWVRRDGRWQQVASQLTPVVGRRGDSQGH